MLNCYLVYIKMFYIWKFIIYSFHLLNSLFILFIIGYFYFITIIYYLLFITYNFNINKNSFSPWKKSKKNDKIFISILNFLQKVFADGSCVIQTAASGVKGTSGTNKNQRSKRDQKWWWWWWWWCTLPSTRITIRIMTY